MWSTTLATPLARWSPGVALGWVLALLSVVTVHAAVVAWLALLQAKGSGCLCRDRSYERALTARLVTRTIGE